MWIGRRPKRSWQGWWISLATRSKCSTAPGSTTGIDLIGYTEQVLNNNGLNHRYIVYTQQVLNGTWLNNRYTDLICYQQQVLNNSWINHRYTNMIGYPEQLLNRTWLNHRYGSDWLSGASAQQHLAQPQVWIWLATRSKCSTAPGSTTGILIWLATRSKCSTPPGSTTGMDLIGYLEQVLNSTRLNHRYGSDWLPGLSAPLYQAQPQVWIWLATRSKRSTIPGSTTATVPGSTTGMLIWLATRSNAPQNLAQPQILCLIDYHEQVLNSTWLSLRYMDLIGYSKEELKISVRLATHGKCSTAPSITISCLK